MPISLQADATLPQGYILVNGDRVASVSTTGGLSAVLAANTVTTTALVSGAVTTEKIAPGAVITADLADGAVTAQKMSGNQTGSAPVYGCRAWVNFHGGLVENVPQIAYTGLTVSVTAGNAFGILNNGAPGLTSALLGNTIRFPSILGVTGATLGGVDVATQGIQYTEIISSSLIRFRFLSGQIPTSNQTIAGVTGNATAGFTYQNLGVRGSGNVSRVERNGTGDYTIVFQTPMPDAFYCMTHSVGDTDSLWADDDGGAHPFTKTLSSARVYVGYGKSDGNIAFVDYNQIDLAFFR